VSHAPVDTAEEGDDEEHHPERFHGTIARGFRAICRRCAGYAMKAGLPSNRTVQLAFGSAIAILLVVGVLSYRSVVMSKESSRWVEHTQEVLQDIQLMRYSMESVPASVRGYALTGREIYADNYRLALADVERYKRAVQDLTVDNPSQQLRLLALDKPIAESTARATMIVDLRRTQGMEAAAKYVDAGPDLETTGDFETTALQMIEEEYRLLALRNADAALRLTQTKTILFAGILLGLLIAGTAGWSVQSDNARRWLAERALQESERKYRMLIEGVKDYAILMLGPLGEIRSWNPGAERMTGWTFEGVAGRNFSCFFPSEDVERGKPAELLRLTAANGEYEEQGTRVRSDGTRYQVRTSYTASRDPTGNLRGFSVISRDLSESTESGAKYRGLMEAAPDAMVVVNTDGQIVLLNVQAEKQFGYHRDELLGQKVTNIIPEGFAERLIADDLRSTEDALAQRIGTGIELNALRKDGSEFPIEIMLSPLESPEGTLVTAAIRDISVRKNAEKVLAQMEGKYRGLMEAAPDAMVVVSQRGEIVLLNLQAEKQFGYRRDELIGQRVTNIIPEGFAERLVADDLRSAEDALAQEIGTGIELTGQRKDGSEFPIELMLSPLQSTEGMLITAAIRDISVRKNAEKVLAQMEGKYRGLMEAAPDAMVVVNQSGEIVLLNLQAEKQFGYRRDELLGQKVTNIIPEGFAERLVADDLRSAEDALAQEIGTGIELNALRKDGSQFPIELMLSPLDSTEGTLVTAAIRDITVRRNAEKHLAQMEGRYRGLLEAAPDPMVVVNQGGEIVLLNLQAEKQFGYRRNELLGQKVTNIIPQGFAERLIADGLRSAEDALAQQIGTGIELSGRRKDRTEFPIELMLSPLGGAEGILVTAAIRNIGVRKTAEAHLLQKMEELNRSNEELGQFAYIASHDLQEPLRMVASYTQLLARRYKGKLDADADEFIAYAVDGATRMQRLIQDLLAYSRVGTKGKELRDTSSETALQMALSNLRGAIEESGALITHDPLPNVLADEMQLIQLFQNLVGNAIKYQKPGTPKIHVAALNGGKQYRFSVTDNGLGIDPQYFERIFGMFQRLHKREEFAGTGIGLAICKKIVERHGGQMSVESQPGQGSTFRFALTGGEKR
jgi:PAS domain S-box-containing protein